MSAFLTDLNVKGLGVIEVVSLHLGPGMTALTGETGAGKTLLVEAIELLMGSRGDPSLVRNGSGEATVEGRFVLGRSSAQQEVILARSVPVHGRTRAWVDGRMAPISLLAETGASLIDLYGQHEHQSLLSPAVQRAALDVYGSIDLGPMQDASATVKRIRASLEAIGGDERARLREIDLLGFQIEEIDKAGIENATEDESLAAEELRLGSARERRQAAEMALAAIEDHEHSDHVSASGRSAVDRLGLAVSALADKPGLNEVGERVSGLQAELMDVARELRSFLEDWEDDPERIDDIRRRRQLLVDLRRKYGETLAEVIEYRAEIGRHLDDLASTEQRAAELQEELVVALDALAVEESRVGAARREAAQRLGPLIQSRLRDLAMPRAEVHVSVGEADPGDDVRILLAANPGGGLHPLAKVASGGELARAMLAVRLVLSGGRSVMVFDEVDAGIGGEAALAVGAALAELADQNQVLVVTHLAQVAAFADQQVKVSKRATDDHTVTTVSSCEGEDRIEELARMLSGQPESDTARRHALELLTHAQGKSLSG